MLKVQLVFKRSNLQDSNNQSLQTVLPLLLHFSVLSSTAPPSITALTTTTKAESLLDFPTSNHPPNLLTAHLDCPWTLLCYDSPQPGVKKGIEGVAQLWVLLAHISHVGSGALSFRWEVIRGSNPTSSRTMLLCHARPIPRTCCCNCSDWITTKPKLCRLVGVGLPLGSAIAHWVMHTILYCT